MNKDASGFSLGKLAQYTGFGLAAAGVATVFGAGIIGHALEAFGVTGQTSMITSGLLNSFLGIHTLTEAYLVAAGGLSTVTGLAVAVPEFRGAMVDTVKSILSGNVNQEPEQTGPIISDDMAFRGELRKQKQDKKVDPEPTKATASTYVNANASVTTDTSVEHNTLDPELKDKLTELRSTRHDQDPRSDNSPKPAP